eukprot:2157249-Pyramimonas_sp.AAC.1
MLFHHVLRCRTARPMVGSDGLRAPLDNLQAAAQVTTLAHSTACIWRAHETSDSVHIPVPPRA